MAKERFPMSDNLNLPAVNSLIFGEGTATFLTDLPRLTEKETTKNEANATEQVILDSDFNDVDVLPSIPPVHSWSNPLPNSIQQSIACLRIALQNPVYYWKLYDQHKHHYLQPTITSSQKRKSLSSPKSQPAQPYVSVSTSLPPTIVSSSPKKSNPSLTSLSSSAASLLCGRAPPPSTSSSIINLSKEKNKEKEVGKEKDKEKEKEIEIIKKIDKELEKEKEREKGKGKDTEKETGKGAEKKQKRKKTSKTSTMVRPLYEGQPIATAVRSSDPNQVKPSTSIFHAHSTALEDQVDISNIDTNAFPAENKVANEPLDLLFQEKRIQGKKRPHASLHSKLKSSTDKEKRAQLSPKKGAAVKKVVEELDEDGLKTERALLSQVHYKLQLLEEHITRTTPIEEQALLYLKMKEKKEEIEKGKARSSRPSPIQTPLT